MVSTHVYQDIAEWLIQRETKKLGISLPMGIQDILERQDRKLFYKFKNNACQPMSKEKESPKGIKSRTYVGPIIRNAHGLGWLVNALCWTNY